mmetsp:Transcript_136748/g.237474  ORF Transcript_136748/g.237474 Transcript_136748/m.237474 type:complete len:230 (+) Transcript_136748:594-1283(+)
MRLTLAAAKFWPPLENRSRRHEPTPQSASGHRSPCSRCSRTTQNRSPMTTNSPVGWKATLSTSSPKDLLISSCCSLKFHTRKKPSVEAVTMRGRCTHTSMPVTAAVWKPNSRGSVPKRSPMASAAFAGTYSREKSEVPWESTRYELLGQTVIPTTSSRSGMARSSSTTATPSDGRNTNIDKWPAGPPTTKRSPKQHTVWMGLPHWIVHCTDPEAFSSVTCPDSVPTTTS